MSIRKHTWKNADGVESTRWIADILDTNGHRERRQFDSRKEAEAFRVATEGLMRAGTFRGAAAKFTVKDAATSFLTYCEGRRQRGERMSRQNYKTMEGNIRNYICRVPNRHKGKPQPIRLKTFDVASSAIKLSQLTASGVGDLRDRLRDAGVTAVTIRKILCTLQEFLQHAISRDMIGINVARGVKVIGRRDEGTRKIVPPTKEALRALLGVADRDFKLRSPQPAPPACLPVNYTRSAGGVSNSSKGRPLSRRGSMRMARRTSLRRTRECGPSRYRSR